MSAVLIISCAGEEEKRVDIFRFRIGADPPSLDPVHSTDTISGAIVSHIFDGLVKLDPETGEVVPAVADTFWSSQDGKVWTFRLKKGVRFHNGREVIARDFHYSFERVLSPETRSERPWVLEPILGARDFIDGIVFSVEGIQAVDDYTLVITLEEHFAPFLAQLCMEIASVVPSEEVAKRKEDFSSHPVGCGPFKFSEWKHDVQVRLERFDDYYGQRAHIDGIEYDILPDVSVALEKYKAGELDLLDDIPPGQVRFLKGRFPDEVKIWPVMSIRYLGMDLQREPFRDNVLLRKAINYAIDKINLCDVIMEGCAVPAKGVLPPLLWDGKERLDVYPYSPKKAKELLEEAGFPDGEGLPELTLWHPNSQAEQRVWQFVQANLQDIGIKTKLKSLDWAVYLSVVRRGRAQLFRGSWVADYADPHNFLYILLYRKNFGEAGNYARYSNLRFDALVEEAKRERDPHKRRKLYREAESIAVEEVPWAFLFHTSDRMIIKPEWKGVVLSQQGDWMIPLERVYK